MGCWCWRFSCTAGLASAQTLAGGKRRGLGKEETLHVSTMNRVRAAARGFGVAALAGALAVAAPAPAAAQDAPVEVSVGVDFPSLYYYRGVRQELDPGLTMWPWVDVGIPIMEGDGAVKSASLNVGSFNSIHTGSNKDDFDGAFYESDFYATLGLGFAGWSLDTTYTAYMYPAPDFEAIHEIAFRGTVDNFLSPYGLVAFEFAEDEPGTYFEIGIGPSFALTDAEEGPSLDVPVKIGFDVNDYYGGDTGFAFFSIGGTVNIPLQDRVSLRGGVELLSLSDTLEFFNVNEDFETSKTGFVGFVGIGFAF